MPVQHPPPSMVDRERPTTVDLVQCFCFCPTVAEEALFRRSVKFSLDSKSPPHSPPCYGKYMRVHDRHCSKQSRSAKQKSKNKALQ